MKEVFEFRVAEDVARARIPPDAGRSTGLVRTLSVSRTDPLFETIGQIDEEMRHGGRAFFTSWSVKRTYTKQEFESADLLLISPQRVFEPAGEECGTSYDERNSECNCGGKAVQTGDLFLEKSSLPSADFSKTIAGEVVVSKRVVDLSEEEGLTGAVFGAVQYAGHGNDPSASHWQLVDATRVDLDSATEVGESPFDKAPHDKRGCGVVGINLLSQVVVRQPADGQADWFRTAQKIGARRGLLRPRPLLLISQKAYRSFCRSKLNGLTIEPAVTI